MTTNIAQPDFGRRLDSKHGSTLTEINDTLADRFYAFCRMDRHIPMDIKQIIFRYVYSIEIQPVRDQIANRRATYEECRFNADIIAHGCVESVPLRYDDQFAGQFAFMFTTGPAFLLQALCIGPIGSIKDEYLKELVITMLSSQLFDNLATQRYWNSNLNHGLAILASLPEPVKPKRKQRRTRL